jgi:hypothetical protein
MISPTEIFEVTRIEYHALSLCPCLDCKAERERRSRPGPSSNIKYLSVPAAFLFGFISRRSTSGSVARELALRGERKE